VNTQIFATYYDFLKRPDLSINGVSPQFVERNPQYAEQNASNKRCWNCSGCSGCSGCSDCSGCSGCSGCSDCSGCSRCFDCSDCSDCYSCSDCYGKEGSQDLTFQHPVIPSIHAAVLAVASNPDALNMKNWHTCETTHCRAGWVVVLAGAAGKELEAKTSTMFAAMQIYKASSPIRVSPTRFFETNEKAMEDMKRCAAEEAALKEATK
jgi:hypothetical protein